MATYAVARAEQRFFSALRDLYLRAGEPSSRSIAVAIGGVSHTTINLAIRGSKVPSWPITVKLVEHFGGEVEEFRNLWVETREPVEPKASATSSEVSVFVSYAHIDDEATYERISKLIKDIANTYRSMTGKEVGVFQDVNSISPGENWKDRIRLGLSYSSIFLAFVTPAYFRSPYCREELSEFLAFLDANSTTRLAIPLLYADPERMETQFKDDHLWQKLASLQRVDISNLRVIDPGSSEWIRRVQELSDTVDKTLTDVKELLDNLEVEKSVPTNADQDEEAIQEGLLERMTQVEEAGPGMLISMEHFTELLNQIGAVANESSPQMTQAETFGEKLAASNRLAKRLGPIAADMEHTADSLVRDFEGLNSMITYILSYARENPEEVASSPDAIDGLQKIWEMAETGTKSLGELDSVNKSLTDGIGYSKNLDKPLRAMRRAFLRLADLRGILSGWRDDLLALGSVNPRFLPSSGAE